VWPLHRVGLPPPRERLAKFLATAEGPAIAKILIDVAEGSLDLSLVLGVTTRRDMDSKAVVRCEVDESDMGAALLERHESGAIPIGWPPTLVPSSTFSAHLLGALL
jgi:hypothetical protein